MLFTIPSKTLYIKDNNDRIREWKIIPKNGLVIISHGLIDGKKTEKVEIIKANKSGRNLYQQTKLRYDSKIHTQRLKGYKNTIAEALSDKTNLLGFKMPMLAQSFKKVKNIALNTAYLQYKYDGHRCLITNRNGQLIAYSRKGKLIDSISHILENIQLKEGETLDGELYCHTARFQDLSSWIRRSQQNSLKLRYHCYDIIQDKAYSLRLDYLRKKVKLGSTGMVVPTLPFEEVTSISQEMQIARRNGYEGIIIRTNDKGYEDGKRSRSLLKVKQFADDEFKIVDINLSSQKVPVITCVTDEQKQFNVTAPGTLEEKNHFIENKNKFLGQYLTVEFSDITDNGLPFQPVAIRLANNF